MAGPLAVGAPLLTDDDLLAAWTLGSSGSADCTDHEGTQRTSAASSSAADSASRAGRTHGGYVPFPSVRLDRR